MRNSNGTKRFSKTFCMIFVLIFMLHSSALASEMSIVDVTSDYGMWCTLFGVDDLSTKVIKGESDYGPFVSVDRIDISYYSMSLQVKHLIFYTKHALYDEPTEPEPRLYAILAALECGQPDESLTVNPKTSLSYLEAIKETVRPIADAMMESKKENRVMLRIGEMIKFYASERYVYYVMWSENYGLFIVVM